MTTKWPCDNVKQSTKMFARVFVDDCEAGIRIPWQRREGFLFLLSPSKTDMQYQISGSRDDQSPKPIVSSLKLAIRFG